MKRSCQRHTHVFDFAGLVHDLMGADAVSALQDDLSSPECYEGRCDPARAPPDGGGQRA